MTPRSLSWIAQATGGRVVGTGHADRLGDGSGAIAQHHGAARIGKAGEDIGDDLVAILGPRIVVGDDGHVRAAFGDRRHLRTLAAITFAATAEHADQFAGGMRAQRGQRLLQRVRRVRVVDHHQRQPALAAEAVHAAIHRHQLRQGFRNQRWRHAHREQGGGDAEQVVDVEAAEQRRTHRVRLVASLQQETDAAAVELDFLCAHAGAGAAA